MAKQPAAAKTDTKPADADAGGAATTTTTPDSVASTGPVVSTSMPKIPSADELEALAAEEAKKNPPPEKKGDGPAPLDVERFGEALLKAKTPEEVGDLVFDNRETIAALDENTRTRVVEAVERRVAHLKLIASIPDPVAEPTREFVVRTHCYPVVAGQRLDCPAGTVVHWTQRQIDEALAQGVMLDSPGGGTADPVERLAIADYDVQRALALVEGTDLPPWKNAPDDAREKSLARAKEYVERHKAKGATK